VGGGPQEQALKEQAKRLGLEDKVIFTGRVPHSEVQRYYDLIDVLAYPRHSMRLTELVTPLKPLEAMAQMRLVAASDVGGHRELIADGVTGTLFKPNNPDDLAKQVAGLLAQPEIWDERRKTARQYVEQDRNWSSNISRYEPVYYSLAERSQQEQQSAKAA
jgi:glycosyltransferase involved in cell wall biosynthesis